MPREPIEFLSGIVLLSHEPARLAAFYKKMLGCPLVADDREDQNQSWSGVLGEVHFAIHGRGDYPGHNNGHGGHTVLSFHVFDLNSYLRELEDAGLKPLYPPRDLGWCLMSAVRDPDGNLVELTQLTGDWYRHLEGRRNAGLDVVARWRSSGRD